MVFVRFRLNVTDFHLCYWIKLNKINDWLKYSKFLSGFYFCTIFRCLVGEHHRYLI